jgi:hypothetical protein
VVYTNQICSYHKLPLVCKYLIYKRLWKLHSLFFYSIGLTNNQIGLFRVYSHLEIVGVPRDERKNSENSLMLFHSPKKPSHISNTQSTPSPTPTTTTTHICQTTYSQPHILTHTYYHVLLPQTSPTNSSHVLLQTINSTKPPTLTRPTSDTIIPTPKEPLYSQSFNPIIFHPNNPHPFRRKIPCEKTSKKRGFTPSYYHPWIPSTLT